MSCSVLIKGSLFRDPESKTSSSGNAFVKATIKVAGGTDGKSDFWSVMCFSETAKAALLDLRDGDHCAIQGALKVEIYNNKISRSVFADQVLALRVKKKRAEKSALDAKPSAVKSAKTESLPFNDDIPF
jgi:single-stranded DNA-binding protein